jgi:hypothetical protein
VNIETTELINRLRKEEDQRHEEKLFEEGERHAREVKLIDALHETFAGWEAQAENSKPATSPAPAARVETIVKRRGRPPGSGVAKIAKIVPAAKQPDRSGTNGFKAVRERIAREPGVNVAAEARKWIALNGNKSFTMDEIVMAIHEKNPTIAAPTIKARLFPFFQHLEEKGQLDVQGERRNYTYTATASFDPTPKRHGVTAPLTPVLSAKEIAYREMRAGIATAPATDQT